MTPDVLANERAFIGSLLRSSHEYWRINELVTTDMFTLACHRDIFSAIRDLSERNRPVTTPALLAHLPEEYDEGNPTIAILETLKANAEEAGSPFEYAEGLARHAAAKRIDQLGEWMRKEIKADRKSPEDIAAEASLRLQEIMTVSSPLRPVRIGELASQVMRQANAASTGDVLPGLNTGIASLDEIMGLMLGGDLGFVIASQSDGKSVMGSQIGMHAAAAGRTVLYIQLEMSGEQMGARELAALSDIPVNSINEGAFDAFQWESMVEAERMLHKASFHVMDAEEMTVRQIKSQAASMMRNGGLSLVVVDQLDKIKAEGKHRDRFERLAEITRDLKKAAKALKVPFLVMAQRTRGAQRRDDPTPDILDADAPSIERDADFVIGLWQRVNWLRRNKPDPRSGEDGQTAWQTDMYKSKDKAEIICLKRRRGRAFDQKVLRFNGPRMRFEEIT